MVTFDTVHVVRRYGARPFFSTDQLNPHRKKRLFYRWPPYSTVRCGAVFKICIPTVRCVSFFFFLTVRCGADRFFSRILRCGTAVYSAVLLQAK